MTDPDLDFASDNTSPAHPAVIEAIRLANEGPAASYGADAIMDGVRARLREIFEAPEAAVYLVGTGTAANALALATFCAPWGAVFCHRNAHIEEDECGAPEFFTGGSKLVLVDGAHARMTPEGLDRALRFTARAGVHNVQKGMLSLTNATENGTVYAPGEVAKLAALARAHGLPCHLDGARFANALVSQGCTPAEATWKAGIDVLSFGGTKNGLMAAEAVVIFDPARAWEFELRRKRAGHLVSKHRFVSAQMQAYLEGDLWVHSARAANRAAQRLSDGIAAVPGARLDHPTEANAVFASFPRVAHRRAMAAGAHYYLWPGDQPLEGPGEAMLSCRLVCSWNTSDPAVDRMIGLIAG